MGDSADQPNWKLLPHNPQRFFELADGYDRKDLKRSYNRWIRQFKPETHPAEFQRIRAAFESLDQDLRYGGGIGAPSSAFAAADVETWPTPQPVEISRPSQHSTAPVLALHERVATESPAELYAELRDKQHKSAYDYYALAVLSDLCERQDGLRFFRWLIEGIANHRREYALLHLLQAYFRGPVAAADLPKLLIAAAKAIGNDAFYPVTEPGWELLLRTAPLETFVSTLRKCESQLRDVNLAGKMAFTIRMLRAAQWKAAGAPPAAAAWTTEAMGFIEGNFEHIPPEATFEVDLLSIVAEYLAVRQAFAARSPLHAALDRTLQTFFVEDQVAADRALIEQQMRLTAEPEVLLAAFRIDNDEPEFAAFYPIWAWTCDEVHARHVEAEQEIAEAELWSRRIRALLVQLEAASKKSSLGQVWNLSGCAYFLAMAAACVAVIVPLAMHFMTERGGSLSAADIAIAATLTVVLGVAVFLPKWGAVSLITRGFHWFSLRMAIRSYNTQWRREVYELLGRAHLPFVVYRHLFAQHVSEQLSCSAWISQLMAQDYALALYALALRHVV